MGREVFEKLFHKIKGNKKSSKKEKTLPKNNEIKVTETYCYNIMPDGTWIIGTRKELEGKHKIKSGLLKEMSLSTYNKFEASLSKIDEGSLKKLEANVNAKSTQKITTEGGDELSLDAKFDATVKAVIDLSSLMVELGAEVTASIKVQATSRSIDLGPVSIQGFVNASAVAKASARLKISPTGVIAEAKAMAEAKAQIGASMTAPKFFGAKYDLKIEVNVEAYAKAEASAMAAAGVNKVGASVGAVAAVGVRVNVIASILGTVTVRDEIAHGKQVSLPNSALGSIGLQVDLQLSTGFSATMVIEALEEYKDPDSGLYYLRSSISIGADLPIAFGAAGGGIIVYVEVNVLKEIWDEFIDKLKSKIKDAIIKLVGEKVMAKYNELVAEAEKIARELDNNATKAAIAFVDFIGMKVTATKMEMDRQDEKTREAFLLLSLEPTAEELARLKGRYEKYHEFLTQCFDDYTVKLPEISRKISNAIEKVKAEKGHDAPEVQKLIKELKEKVEKILKTLRKIALTEQKLTDLASVDPSFTQLPEALVKDIKKSANFMDVLIKGIEKTMDAF